MKTKGFLDALAYLLAKVKSEALVSTVVVTLK